MIGNLTVRGDGNASFILQNDDKCHENKIIILTLINRPMIAMRAVCISFIFLKMGSFVIMYVARRTLAIFLGLCLRCGLWKFDPAYSYCYYLGDPVDVQCDGCVR